MAKVQVITTESGKNNSAIVINGTGDAGGIVENAVMIGEYAQADDGCVALGAAGCGSSNMPTHAMQSNSVAIGNGANAGNYGELDGGPGVAIGGFSMAKLGVSIGSHAGENAQTPNNVFIGNDATVGSSGDGGCIVVGNGSVAGSPNQVVIGHGVQGPIESEGAVVIDTGSVAFAFVPGCSATGNPGTVYFNIGGSSASITPQQFIELINSAANL